MSTFANRSEVSNSVGRDLTSLMFYDTLSAGQMPGTEDYVCLSFPEDMRGIRADLNGERRNGVREDECYDDESGNWVTKRSRDNEFTVTALCTLAAVHKKHSGSARGQWFFTKWLQQWPDLFELAGGVHGIASTYQLMGPGLARKVKDADRTLAKLKWAPANVTSEPQVVKSGSIAVFDIPDYDFDDEDIDPRDWLYGDHYIRGYVTGTVAPGGSGKSSLALVECLSMALGRCLVTGKRIKRQRVAYWGGEDNFKELKRRVRAVRKHYGLAKSDLQGWFGLVSGLDVPITIATEGPNGFEICVPNVDALVAVVQRRKYDVLVIDPFIKSHGVSENDNTRIDKVMRAFAQVAVLGNCSVELVQHVRKMNGGEVTADDSRGASSFKDGTRGLRTINRMTSDEAGACLVEDSQRHRFIRLDDGKVNMTPPGAAAKWFELVSVDLENARDGKPSDKVGVVTPFTWRAPHEGLADGHVLLVQAQLGDGVFRYQPTASGWVGDEVGKALDMTTADRKTDKVNRRRIANLVDQWVNEGWLVKFTQNTKAGQGKEFVRVGKVYTSTRAV